MRHTVMSENNIYTKAARDITQQTIMSTQKVLANGKMALKMNSKVIKVKTQEFLSSRKKLQPLNDILQEFVVSDYAKNAHIQT